MEEKNYKKKFQMVVILLILAIIASVLFGYYAGSKINTSKQEGATLADDKKDSEINTRGALNILVEEQSDEPYPYDDVSVLYGIWKATDADYIKKEGQEGYADFEKDSEYNELSEVYLLFKEDNTVIIYDGYEKKSEKLNYEAEMMEEFDGQVNVVVFETVNNNSILRKFSLDHQTKILTLAYIEDRGVADVYFKKINSSTDESVFK